TYGACCVDDYTAKAMGCDLLIHYGHSCLLPVTSTEIQTLYVFVDIKFDSDHLVATLKANLSPALSVSAFATIQFVASLQNAKGKLAEHFRSVSIPQQLPLSPGEVLGCTSPKVAADVDAMIYVGDGRFHLESSIIH